MLSSDEIRDIEQRATRIAAYLEWRDGKFRADIRPGIEPRWHLVATVPNKEAKAARFLADRGFGVFMPRFDSPALLRVRHPNGRSETIDMSGKLVFPGRIFLFVWDVLHHWRQVKACPGVLNIVVDDRERPVTISDSDMDWIQAVQYGLAPHKRKRYKGKTGNTCEFVKVSTASFMELDGPERNRLLERQLSVAS